MLHTVNYSMRSVQILLDTTNFNIHIYTFPFPTSLPDFIEIYGHVTCGILVSSSAWS